MGWRICPADSDHALYPFEVSINSGAALAELLSEMTKVFTQLVEEGHVPIDGGNVTLSGIDEAMNVTGMLNKNWTSILHDIITPCDWASPLPPFN